MSRVDQYEATLSLNGQDLGVFDKLTGGAMDSDEIKYKPGGMAPQVSLGGSTTTDNVTLERLYRLDRDLPLVPLLKSQVGRGQLVAKKQSLDVDGNPFGNPIIYQGKFKKLTLPEHDSESSSAALMQIELSSEGTVTA